MTLLVWRTYITEDHTFRLLCRYNLGIKGVKEEIVSVRHNRVCT